MRYIIGIDQGATKTSAALADENGNIMATCKTSGGEHHYVGIEVQMATISEACSDLLKQTGLNTKDISIIYGGLTGVDWPEEPEYLQGEIRKLGFCDNVFAVNDSIVALRGGTSRSYGAIIIAGTGANCALISPEGKEFIYGFYAENAIQGGQALGRHVLDAVFKSAMGRLDDTLLTERVMKRYNIHDIDALLRAYIENRLEDTKHLAVDLFEAAYAGDKVSADIIKWFGRELASLVNARAKIFNMENEEFEVVVSGSIFKGPSTLLVDVVTSEIHGVCPRTKIVNARYEPVAGAVLLALEKLHGRHINGVDDNIEKSCREFGLLRIDK